LHCNCFGPIPPPCATQLANKMAARALIVFALLCLPSAEALYQADASESVAASNANPIRKVVVMLQTMQKKITAEGEKEQELYDKFMCYCKNAGGDLSKSIADADTKIPQLGSDIEEAEAKKKQLDEDLKSHQMDRSAAKEAMASATAIREKEAAAFAKEEAELKANIAALTGATKAITSGMAGGFLQTRGASVLRHLLEVKTDMMEADREDITAFLSGTSNNGYVPQAGQIAGILKEMTDEMSKDLADTTAAETAAIESYEGLMAAKTKEVEALTKAIETKTVLVGETAVSIVQMKNDLSDTEAALIEDKKFLADMDKNCELKTKEWDERSKTRSQELLAIADTIKILNDDDALELFKKTLPSAAGASFVQVHNAPAEMRRKALSFIGVEAQSVWNDSPRMDFITMAIRGKKIGFEKVIKMIDEMVATLKQEQLDDDHKKEYCGKQLDLSDDKKKSLEQTISDLETTIAEAEEGISTSASEIEKLEAGIKKLDKSVAEATEQRKEEHEDFTELMASDSAAKELLKFAKNRLNKFYNPKLYKAPPKEEPELVEIRAHAGKEAPPPPPETFGAYSKKTEESGGVIAMVDLLIKDLDKEMTEAETSEEDAQKDYEELMKDSAEKRAQSSKSLTEKQETKAALEADLESHKEEKASTKKELGATVMYIQSLHAECDWLLQYFDMRKTARADEVDALGKAKAVLSGADFS